MRELTYINNIASAQIDYDKLSSQTKPYLSFDYDLLFYTENEKTYVYSGKKYPLNSLQIKEIDSFLDNLFEQKEKIKVNQVIHSLQNYLKETDWMVIREFETGVPVPEAIKLRREDTRKKIDEMKKYL